MNNDTYILMGGRGVKNNPYQTLKALVLYEENKKLKRKLTEIKELLLKTPTDSREHFLNAKSVILQICDEVNKDDTDDLSGHWLFEKGRDEKKKE